MLSHFNIDTSKICIYCKKDTKVPWKNHYEHFLYKTRTCDCGKKTHVRTNILTDGNDGWNKKRGIEERVK